MSEQVVSEASPALTRLLVFFAVLVTFHCGLADTFRAPAIVDLLHDMSLCRVRDVPLHPVNPGRRGRDEHRQLLQPLQAHLLSHVVVVVSLGGNVDNNDHHLDGDQAQNDDDDDGENSHSCDNQYAQTQVFIDGLITDVVVIMIACLSQFVRFDRRTATPFCSCHEVFIYYSNMSRPNIRILFVG